jgi:hypothetical protein
MTAMPFFQSFISKNDLLSWAWQIKGWGKTKMDKAELTSYIVLIITPIVTYFGFSEATQNAVVGVITGLIMLYIAIMNEKHPSDVLSQSSEEPEDDGEDMDGQ